MKLFGRRKAAEMNKSLTVGDRLQVLNERDQEYYTCHIRETGKEIITICEPVSGGKELPMPHNSSWQFCLVKDDAVYLFNSLVIGVNRNSVEKHYLVKKPYTVERHQRRGHIRVPCHFELRYWCLDDPAIKNSTQYFSSCRTPGFWEDPLWIEERTRELESIMPGRAAFTLDLSGGGLRMVVSERLKRNDHLLIKIKLNGEENHVFLLEGKVVRVVTISIGRWKRYRAGVSFININENVRERIINYLFESMRNKE